MPAKRNNNLTIRIISVSYILTVQVPAPSTLQMAINLNFMMQMFRETF